MLNTPESIARFKEFTAAGGLKLPESYNLASEMEKRSKTLYEGLSNVLDPELDYDSAGIGPFITSVNALADGYLNLSDACQSWTSYLDKAAYPNDLIQVAIGVDVIRKLNDDTSDTPAPSIIPIIDSTVIEAGELALDSAEAITADVISLIEQINAAITPPPPPAPVPPLPEDLKEQALEMANQITPLQVDLNNKGKSISDTTSQADQDRAEALKAMTDAVNFTLCENGEKNSLISDAIAVIYPDSSKLL
ncbi:hypothetical protein [Photobacterium damselae]|uniref:hypothetical protein n=1 Tax=Photobacterium damselae TaxID=38293 RepID=UPI001F2B90D2|nr:hypothetical protein [Photobacterium damselae]UKA12877.1 hypothetical protein IHC91_21025 [Photobacterium damselae subsp. damselae]